MKFSISKFSFLMILGVVASEPSVVASLITLVPKYKTVIQSGSFPEVTSSLSGLKRNWFSHALKQYPVLLRSNRKVQVFALLTVLGLSYGGYRLYKKYYPKNSTITPETPQNINTIKLKDFITIASPMLFSQRSIDSALKKIALSYKNFEAVTFVMTDELKRCLSEEQQSKEAVKALGENCTVRMLLESLKADSAGEEIIEMVDGFETALQVLASTVNS